MLAIANNGFTEAEVLEAFYSADLRYVLGSGSTLMI